MAKLKSVPPRIRTHQGVCESTPLLTRLRFVNNSAPGREVSVTMSHEMLHKETATMGVIAYLRSTGWYYVE